MVKTTKGGKVMNPTDAYRKELRKKELKRGFVIVVDFDFLGLVMGGRRVELEVLGVLPMLWMLENKKERKKVREVGILKKDPEQIREQIQKLETMKAEGALDKARKHKKRQLEDTLNLVLKKRKEHEEKLKEKGEAPVMFSHLGPVRRRTTAEEEERSRHPKPEDSVYYHPTLNPTGAPPPGKPPMYKSSIGPRIPLEGTESAGAASSSAGPSSSSVPDDETLPSVPPPPPLPPLPLPSDSDTGDGSAVSISLPLPPPPPVPPKPPVSNLSTTLPLPPPPPGPPPKEEGGLRPPPPPPTPLLQSTQPPSSTVGAELDQNAPTVQDVAAPNATNQVIDNLPRPLPPPWLPQKPAGNQSDGAAPQPDGKSLGENKGIPKLPMPPPPPPPRQHPTMGDPAGVPTLPADVLPPGISRFPPPPPQQPMRPPLPIPGAAGLPGMVPLIPRLPYGPPPGPPPMMRPPLPPGPPPMYMLEDHGAFRPPLPPPKPSYVKSAAPTVVKRPLAQHTPELTSMVPASVRVKRETAAPKPKPKPLQPTTTITSHVAPPSISRPAQPATTSWAPKPASIDDSYSAFLEDMKALGALDS
ncbi:EARLY FLOWERING 5-like protein [Drosera capensis]